MLFNKIYLTQEVQQYFRYASDFKFKREDITSEVRTISPIVIKYKNEQ
jgi:hypothetical protein